MYSILVYEQAVLLVTITKYNCFCDLSTKIYKKIVQDYWQSVEMENVAVMKHIVYVLFTITLFYVIVVKIEQRGKGICFNTFYLIWTGH